MGNPDAIQVAANYYSQLCDATELITELRREVAMLRKVIQDVVDTSCAYDCHYPMEFDKALTHTQATALAYEREVENRGAVKALEDAAKELDDRHLESLQMCILPSTMVREMAAELRAANKGEVK